jgi:transcriptional regulator with XRE-family HTH domain
MTIMCYGAAMMGNRLKDILHREKVTAYRICKDLDIDPAQMSRFLNGTGSISLRKLEQVAEYLSYDLQMVKLRPSRERR